MRQTPGRTRLFGTAENLPGGQHTSEAQYVDIVCVMSQYAEVAGNLLDGVGGERKVVLILNTGGGKRRVNSEGGEEGPEKCALD